MTPLLFSPLGLSCLRPPFPVVTVGPSAILYSKFYAKFYYYSKNALNRVVGTMTLF